MNHRYFIVYKPYHMVSQFVSPYEQPLLGDLNFPFPEGTNAVGRLDEDSEGLLILTTDKTLTTRLLHPDKKHLRHYQVQVKGKVEPQTLTVLGQGLDIIIKRRGIYHTKACEVKLIEPPSDLAEREDPVHEFVEHSWLEFVLTEGKNRQIRKMCAAVNHVCKRLIRTKIEQLELGTMKPGEVKELSKETIFELLLLKNEYTHKEE